MDQQQGVRLGVRIEFYDYVGSAPDYAVEGYIGHALSDDCVQRCRGASRG